MLKRAPQYFILVLIFQFCPKYENSFVIGRTYHAAFNSLLKVHYVTHLDVKCALFVLTAP